MAVRQSPVVWAQAAVYAVRRLCLGRTAPIQHGAVALRKKLLKFSGTTVHHKQKQGTSVNCTAYRMIRQQTQLAVFQFADITGQLKNWIICRPVDSRKSLKAKLDF